jgi:hypothetical protein
MRRKLADICERIGMIFCRLFHEDEEVVNYNLATGEYTCGKCCRTYFAFTGEYKPAANAPVMQH